jgi:hypothetical protein
MTIFLSPHPSSGTPVYLEFAGTAAQYDDMTLVAARITTQGSCGAVA